MGLKTTISSYGEGTTTDGTGWSTIASYPIPSNCSFELDNIFLIGKTTNGTLGETAYCKALHRGKKTAAGGLSLIGQPVYLVTFFTGSDTNVRLCAMRIEINTFFSPYTTIELQVKGIEGRNIDWYGGFTTVMN